MLILAAKVIHWTTKSLSIGHALASSEERRITAVSGKKVVWQRPSLVADQNGQPPRSQYSPRTIRSSRQASRVRPGDAFVRCDQILPERPPSHHAEKSSRRTRATGHDLGDHSDQCSLRSSISASTSPSNGRRTEGSSCRVLIGQQVKQFACMLLDGQRRPPEDQVLPVPRTIPYQTLITPSLTIAMPSGSQIPEPVQPASLGSLWRATSLPVRCRCNAKVDHRGLRNPASRSDPSSPSP